ncbi:MAG: family 1 encapsulin nanocompartment shell protein [Desulfuromonadales bacterium]|nr:family 1 encapsulin nanocompartment shell protein [Desulfuromonadales bacterium]
MDLLRRELAPISPQGWREIDTMAKETLIANVSGRKFIDVDGPHGIGHSCVTLGRLSIPKAQKSGKVGYGIHQILPLVEARVNFNLQTWELDNIERGAKDIQLDSLVEACREIAMFEEKAIFGGFDPGSIAGLQKTVKGDELALSLDMDSIVDAVSEGQTKMMKDGVEGPANLVVSAPLWKFLARSTPGGTLRSIVETQIEGKVILSEFVQDALLVASRGGDLELTVGQDFAVGYHSHTSSEISLFVTESFTFRVVAPEAIIGFKLS